MSNLFEKNFLSTAIGRVELLKSWKKLSNAELGRITSLTRQHIGNYLEGKTPMPDEVLKKIAKHCEVNEDWLIRGIEPISEMYNSNDEVSNVVNESEVTYNTKSAREIRDNLVSQITEMMLLSDVRKQKIIAEYFGIEDDVFSSMMTGSRGVSANSLRLFAVGGLNVNFTLAKRGDKLQTWLRERLNSPARVTDLLQRK